MRLLVQSFIDNFYVNIFVCFSHFSLSLSPYITADDLWSRSVRLPDQKKYSKRVCLKRRHVYEALRLLGRSAEINYLLMIFIRAHWGGGGGDLLLSVLIPMFKKINFCCAVSLVDDHRHFGRAAERP